jgi:hypothetical protein
MSLLRETPNPISERKLSANRENAQKSTGPRTPEGKRNSSLNSSRHAILAQSILIEEESADRFAEHLNSFIADFCPSDNTERHLVELMAINNWRMRRFWTLESASIAHEVRHQSEATANETPPTRTMLAIRALNDADRHHDSFGRQERRCQRAFHEAMEALFRYRAEKSGHRTHQLQQTKAQAKAVEPTGRPVEPSPQPVEPTGDILQPKAA